jgi:chromosome partitioning protein
MQSYARPVFLSFASPKGGVGKSTTCASVAGALASHGHPVHILDLDQTRTLHRWVSRFRPQGITLDSVNENELLDRLKRLYDQQTGFVLIDVAGAFSQGMVAAATVADITISPAKLSEPDVMEATKLHYEMQALAERIGKPICHRIVLNEVAALLPSYQRMVLDDLSRSGVQRFDTLMHQRAPYAEVFLTGQPPHFADAQRDPVRKAVQEVDYLLTEIYALLTHLEVRAAA